MLHRRLLPLLLCTLSLSACNGYFGGSDDGSGGGGGGGNSDAQGIWDGTLTSSSMFLSMLATPANEIWAISWNDTFNQVGQLTRGTGALNGKVFSGKGKTFASSQGTVSSGDLSGTVTSGAQFDGNLGQNITFTTTFQTGYNQAYDRAANAGTWQGRDNTSSAVVITVDASGNFSAEASVSSKPGPCTIKGSLTPSTTNKNFATANFSIGSANCPNTIANAVMQGVAFLVNKSGQEPLMMIAGTNNEQTLAWFAYARKDAPASTPSQP